MSSTIHSKVLVYELYFVQQKYVSKNTALHAATHVHFYYLLDER